MGKYLDYNGLSYLWQKIKAAFSPITHNHEIQNLTNYATRVYDATTSRTANTFLAAPNGSAGAAVFRAIAREDLPAHGAATLRKSTSTTTPTSNTKAALNQLAVTDSHMFELSSNGIKCKKAGYVIVTGGYYVSGVGNGGAAILIYQNTTNLGEFVTNCQGQGVGAPVFPARVVSVAANDEFYLYWRTTKAATCAANRVWLTVQYVC
jgi:hypothetical protein